MVSTAPSTQVKAETIYDREDARSVRIVQQMRQRVGRPAPAAKPGQKKAPKPSPARPVATRAGSQVQPAQTGVYWPGCFRVSLNLDSSFMCVEFV